MDGNRTEKYSRRVDSSFNILTVVTKYVDGKPLSCSFELKLVSEARTRKIARYVYESKTLYVKRDSRKHYHRAMHGYGFNSVLLEYNEIDVRDICLQLEDGTYTFPRHVIDTWGRYLNFKQQGFELQRFVSFELIKRYAKETRND